MGQILDYGIYIKSIYKELEQRIKTSQWQDDEWLIETFETYRDCIKSQIHDILVPIGTRESENEIREIISKYVIGYVDKKKKIIYQGALDWISNKIVKIENENKKIKRMTAEQKEYIKRRFEIEDRYKELKDDFMALASFRSYKHYCFYMQDVFGIKLWTENERAFSGYWFYMGRMILDGDVRFLEKQLPTGTGKSLSDCFAHSMIFGVDINSDVFKVCGNDKFTDDCFQNVVKLMTHEKYQKVFPYYSKFFVNKEEMDENGNKVTKKVCDINKMFNFCARKDLKFSISGSTVSTNLRICTKLAETNGIRAKYLFLDDICQADDVLTQMNKDIEKFKREWFRRNYNLKNFYVVASGTTYSQFDILSYLKREMGWAKAQRAAINEFTWISTSHYITKDGISVFVKVPALDSKDESVFPTIRDTFTCRKLRDADLATFLAMEQQEPLPPENSPFYYEKLREYSVLPKVGEQNRMDYCVAALDPKRRGNDFLSMPILFQADDVERGGQSVYYLVDWLYDDRPMKDCIPLIASKIIKHRVTRLVAERNTDECIAKLIEDELAKNDYYSCIIEEVYSTEQKDRRILSAEGDIKSKIIFPEYGMYAPVNEIGKALLNTYAYSYAKKVAHDDAPDSLALFVKHFIFSSRRRNGSVEVLRL